MTDAERQRIRRDRKKHGLRVYSVPLHEFDDLDALICAVCGQAGGDDHIVIMSNGGFGSVRQNLTGVLQNNK